MRRRLELFFVSRRNIVGSILALAGLGLHFIGLFAGLTWLPVVVALYLIGALLVPAERGLDLRLDATRDAAEVTSSLDRFLAGIRGRVADDLYAKAVSIRGSIVATVATENGADTTDPGVYLIRQTALSYLPDAFDTYLRMPRLFAERRAVAGGRTPHDELLDQLDLMDRRLADVADDMARHDSDKLLANGRFLAEKFGVSSLQVEADASAVAAAPVPVAGSTVEAPTAVPDPAAERERERVH